MGRGYGVKYTGYGVKYTGLGRGTGVREYGVRGVKTTGYPRGRTSSNTGTPNVRGRNLGVFYTGLARVRGQKVGLKSYLLKNSR